MKQSFFLYLIGLSIISLGSSSGYVHPINNASFQNDVKQQMRQIIDDELKESKTLISPEANSLLDKFVESGVNNLDSEDKKKIDEAKQNLRKFMESLIKNSVKTKAGGLIKKDGFETTKASVCPLYPFC
jgi:molecular chaperone DnaK (HSP70)